MSIFLKTTGGLILTAFAMGFKKLQELKQFFKQLDFQMDKIYDIQISVLENEATFKADITVQNHSDIDLNIHTIGLVKLDRILFYDGERLIASAQTHVSSIAMKRGESMQLTRIPFKTNLTGGISRLQSFLKDRKSNNLQVVLEFEAFNKTYSTRIN